MSLIGSSILAGSAANQGYTIEKSLQFNGSDEHLYRTPSSDGDRQKWTWSGWVKISEVSENLSLFSVDESAATNRYVSCLINSTGELQIFEYTGAAYNYRVNTTALFRDPAAWHHIVIACDTTLPAENERIKFYVNGVRMTEFRLTDFPELYHQTYVNHAELHTIGVTVGSLAAPSGERWHDGYLADIHFIDGQELDANDFGEAGDTYGEWKPKKYAGTYGTNGYFLNFKGTYYEDKSGNGNNWTASNLASSDVVDDTPSNNFATLNPLDKYSNLTISESGLKMQNSTLVNGFAGVRATMGVSSGKWYWEVLVGAFQPSRNLTTIGVDDSTAGAFTAGSSIGSGSISTSFVYYMINGNKINNGTSSTYGATYTTGDVIGVALDLDNGTLTFYKNGVSQGTAFTGLSGTFSPSVAVYSDTVNTSYTADNTFNFGQTSFSYTPPTGYKALSTANLDEPTVVPEQHFNVVNYAGNDGATATKSVTGVGFQPDVVWIKNRDVTSNHNLFTSTLGPQANLAVLTNATNTVLNRGFKSYDSDGFTLTNQGHNDNNEETYVSWNWKAGGSSTTVNTSGTISSNVSVNADAGFSIVTYTGTGGASDSIGHGLGAVPKFIIAHDRDSATFRSVYHVSTGAGNLMRLNTTDAKLTSNIYWGGVEPDTSVFNIGTSSALNDVHDMVAWCWAEVPGYSSFGSYEGNGAADGPFVYTGFRPKFVMIKEADASGSWVILDTNRSEYNPSNNESLWANLDSAEGGSASYLDLLSNGFKIRDTDSDKNTSASTYIYAAFAEYPFKYANARGTSYDKFTSVEDVSALTIAQSARFNADGYLVTSNNPQNGNGDKWTWSGWVKQGYLNNDQWLFGAWSNTSNFTGITFNTGSGLNCYQKNAGSVVFQVRESSIYRDYGAWMHCVVAYDSDHATSSERVRLYVNGERKTNLASASYPSLSLASWMSGTGTNFNLGRGLTTGNAQYKGYLAEVNFIDNQALGPESFGYRDPTYGDWRPKSYVDFGPEVDYGRTGFRLDFQSGSLGTDRSGNGRDFSLTSMSTTSDSVLDSPSNNFATANQLMLRGVGVDVSEGSLYVNRNSAGWGNIAATMGVSSGKWYWEFLNDSTAATMVGVDSELDPTDYVGSTSTGYGYYSVTGNKYNNRSSSSYGNTYTTGDIIGIALDMDNGKIWFAKNGTWQASGDPAAGTNEAFSGLTGTYLPQFSLNNSGGDGYINFGQDSSFAGSQTRQSNQDGNGVGDFYYTPPTGFLALCTSNLSTPSINPKEHFNTVTYTGDGASGHSITGVGFKPELVWLKSRNIAENHAWYDSIRGSGRAIYANLTNAEGPDPGVTSFDSDGFTFGGSTANASGYTYVSWNWNAGDNTVVNSTGTLSANVSANTASGVSIATFTIPTTGSSWTIGHGLGAAPKMIIQKSRSGTSNWGVYHASVGETKGLYLNGTSAEFSASGFWNNTAPTSTVWSIGTSLQDTSDVSVVTYLFAEVEGFSKFGSYTGNASADGPFIYTGFRPAWIMIKSSSNASTPWQIFDSARETYNTLEQSIITHAASAEPYDTASPLDFLSNGFKLRGAGSSWNNYNTGTWIYAVFAEYPFKFTNAR